MHDKIDYGRMAGSNDETWSPWCHTCRRYQKAGETGFLNLADGRQLCSNCSSIAIFPEDREECSFIIQKVYEFFKSCGLQVNEDIPILFVDRNQMRSVMDIYKDPRSAAGLFFPSVSTYTQCYLSAASSLPFPVRLWNYLIWCILPKLIAIPAIIRTREGAYTRSGVNNIAKSIKFFLGDMIMVLYGKPDVEIGGVLAHEIMHGWFFRQGYYPLDRDKSIDEGICEVMRHKWMNWFSSKDFNYSYKIDEQVQYTRKLKEKLALMIELRDDEVYGKGFRNAIRAIKTSGFEATLDHILKKGTLPPVVTTAMRKKSTTSAAIMEWLWKAARSKNKSLWKAAGSKTTSLWKATTVTITNLLLKITGAYETPRFVTMEGQRLHHYHYGQSHNNLYASMSAAPTLLVLFFGILVEHK